MAKKDKKDSKKKDKTADAVEAVRSAVAATAGSAQSLRGPALDLASELADAAGKFRDRLESRVLEEVKGVRSDIKALSARVDALEKQGGARAAHDPAPLAGQEPDGRRQAGDRVALDRREADGDEARRREAGRPPQAGDDAPRRGRDDLRRPQQLARRRRHHVRQLSRWAATFDSPREFKAVMDRVFAMMDEDPKMGPELREADVPMRYEFEDVDLVVNIRAATADEDGNLHWEWSDDVGWDPKVKMAMSSETANKYFQGKENIALAIARRRIKSGGDVKAALALMPVTKPVFAQYRAMLEAEYPHLVV